MSGRWCIAASWVGTGAFAVTAVPSAAGGEGLGYTAVVVALVLFGVSVPLSLYALGAGAVRTAREGERITVGRLFFLRGTAPRRERLHLLGSLGVSLALSVATASAEPFGVLVPVYPLALVGLWAAIWGRFPKLPEPTP